MLGEAHGYWASGHLLTYAIQWPETRAKIRLPAGQMFLFRRVENHIGLSFVSGIVRLGIGAIFAAIVHHGFQFQRVEALAIRFVRDVKRHVGTFVAALHKARAIAAKFIDFGAVIFTARPMPFADKGMAIGFVAIDRDDRKRQR